QRIRDAIAWKTTRPWKRPMAHSSGLLHGINPEIRRINEEARTLARESSKPVILCGEAGTGKEHLAHGMYRISPARGLPFIRYDCRLIQQISRYDGIPVSKFVLTGLQELKKRHHGGVLFLQHLDLLQKDQQRDILEAGGGSAIRLIASCQSSTGTEDIVPSLRLPALRQHPEDIPALAEHFILETAQVRKLRCKSLSQDIIGFMQEYAWPGNIQELSNVIERMMLFEPSGVLSSDSWRASHGYGFRWTLEGASHFSTLIEEVLKNSEAEWEEGALYDQFMERMKKLLADLVLSRVDYNQAMAAKVLGISRNTLREILRQG
ncbi:MAG TPA: sigma 54-interacting transcriptional regulator, partial [Acidobacteriota bacterium]|nr:sigma 54-interacting transcriptional regulator [Acidobacteriota bacterium]